MQLNFLTMYFSSFVQSLTLVVDFKSEMDIMLTEGWNHIVEPSIPPQEQAFVSHKFISLNNWNC